MIDDYLYQIILTTHGDVPHKDIKIKLQVWSILKMETGITPELTITTYQTARCHHRETLKIRTVYM